MSEKLIDYLENRYCEQTLTKEISNEFTNISLKHKGPAIDIDETYHIDVTIGKYSGAIKVNNHETIIEFDGTVEGFENCIYGIELTALKLNLIGSTKFKNTPIEQNFINGVKSALASKNKCSNPVMTPSQELMDACKKPL